MPGPLLLSEAFREAFLHDRHVILGCELRPFCMDHVMILEALNSPMIMGGMVKIEDVQIAVKLCSTRSNEEFFNAAQRPDWKWKLWSRLFKGVPVKGLLDQWDSYIDDYSPKIEQMKWGDEAQDAPKCPYHILTAAKLVERGHDPAGVRRMGIGEVTCWALAIMENNPTPYNPDPLKGIKDDWDVQTAREIAEMERNQNAW